MKGTLLACACALIVSGCGRKEDEEEAGAGRAAGVLDLDALLLSAADRERAERAPEFVSVPWSLFESVRDSMDETNAMLEWTLGAVRRLSDGTPEEGPGWRRWELAATAAALPHRVTLHAGARPGLVLYDVEVRPSADAPWSRTVWGAYMPTEAGKGRGRLNLALDRLRVAETAASGGTTRRFPHHWDGPVVLLIQVD